MRILPPSLLFAATIFVSIACGPPMKPTEHPGRSSFGAPCNEGKCPSELECVRYGVDDARSCEKRCNADSDCGLGAGCSYVARAPSPMCRARGAMSNGPDSNEGAGWGGAPSASAPAPSASAPTTSTE
jgi:hypothetical protein